MSKAQKRQVWSVSWDGEPSMSGDCNRVRNGAEFHTYGGAIQAAKVLGQRGDKQNLWIETRFVTDWKRES